MSDEPHDVVVEPIEPAVLASMQQAALEAIPFRDLSRPAFLFLMAKLGITKETVHGLVDAMPDSTPEEADAKMLARIVFDEQQSFARNNALLEMLAAAAGLTDDQINSAWRQGEALTW